MTSANKWRWTYEGGVAERAFHTTRLLMVTLEMVVSLLSTLNHLTVNTVTLIHARHVPSERCMTTLSSLMLTRLHTSVLHS